MGHSVGRWRRPRECRGRSRPLEVLSRGCCHACSGPPPQSERCVRNGGRACHQVCVHEFHQGSIESSQVIVPFQHFCSVLLPFQPIAMLLHCYNSLADARSMVVSCESYLSALHCFKSSSQSNEKKQHRSLVSALMNIKQSSHVLL